MCITLTICQAKPADTSKDTTNIIQTPHIEFRKAYAELMLTYMNRSVSPCDDFYEYACGNWKNVKLDKYTPFSRSSFGDIIFKLNDAVHEMLSKSTEKLDMDYGRELYLAQQFYNACLRADLYPMQASDHAYLDLISSIGGFPAIDPTWEPENFSWFNMSAHLTNYGAEGLINEELLTDIPTFHLSKLGFKYMVYSDNIATNTTQAYKDNEKRMRNYLRLYGMADEQISKVIHDIFAFWRDVLIIRDRFADDTNKCEELTIELDVETFSQWPSYYEIVWQGNSFDFEDFEHYCDFFYMELEKVCEKHKPAVANYLAMKLLYELDAKLAATEEQPEYCALTMYETLPFLLGELYVEKYLTADIYGDIAVIVSEIRKGFRHLLINADWLKKGLRRKLLQKESEVQTHIGRFKDPKLIKRLIEEMNKLAISQESYAKSNIDLKHFKMFMKRYLGHIDAQSLSSTDLKPIEVLGSMLLNAIYYSEDNSVYIMAGILHLPVYHKYWPSAMKFGATGAVVGHELTHAFDSEEALDDIPWPRNMYSALNERTQCFVDHYNGYKIPEIKRTVNGHKTKEENIADSGGLRAAFIAYHNHIKQLQRNDPKFTIDSELMPGLDLLPNQLFFLSFAQTYCADFTDADYWLGLIDEHTPEKYRVLGAVTNNEDFAHVFQCPLGSPMNPTMNKCQLW
ncbi:neprilysin-1-like [Scaptodrosophila lebanonensis]|uniref:Neprilysin-1-like n=1 Tax=Drosophila lebanonensis TaxID=7225 RepID=A0A6J2T1X1_DROLE|nr:neprilysin-1-like [Scaptodrosophila lebanonensis]